MKINYPHDVFKKSFVNIMEQIAASGKNFKRLAVCSPSFKEGKTTISVAMAIFTAITKPNKRVLLVDLNLRDSQIHNMIKTSEQSGIRECLASGLMIEQVQSRAGIKNLHVIYGGLQPVDFPEVFTEERFEAFLEETKDYDYAFFDTPAVLEYVDAKIIAPLIDGTVMVCRSTKTKPDAFKSAVEMIQNNGGNVCGSILNAYTDPIPDAVKVIL